MKTYNPEIYVKYEQKEKFESERINDEMVVTKAVRSVKNERNKNNQEEKDKNNMMKLQQEYESYMKERGLCAPRIITSILVKPVPKRR